MDDVQSAADAVVQRARADLAERLRVACPYMSADAKEKLLEETFANLSGAIVEQEPAMIAAHDKIPFFKIPREIKDKIYRLVFDASKEKSIFLGREDNSQVRLTSRDSVDQLLSQHQRAHSGPPKGDIRLLLLCRQIRNEAAAVLLSMKTFVVLAPYSWQKFSEALVINRLKGFLDHSGEEAASKINRIILRLNASSVLDIAVNLFSQQGQMTQFVRQDAKSAVSRFAPGFVLDKSKVLAKLGLDGYGIAKSVFRIEYQIAGGSWVEIGEGDHDIEAMEQARIERLQRLEQWYEDGSDSECGSF
ncbi:hypothetical protein HII31_08078 [Pseudocercospora fuligena]|uniref:Uncharacterized protein n=1 Tax=Pseudocercospora fuligena TaxID=685502 RepID=A0A8H6VK33_9PEZI|nr:hypothetical protein HII31_08078 [Pseudocercospora fuligena]